jgi:hypothetical protein
VLHEHSWLADTKRRRANAADPLWVVADAYDPDTRQLEPDRALDRLVARIYHLKFQRHAPDGALDAVLRALAESKLGEQTRGRLPTRPALHCTVRNVNWLLCYWQAPDYPDPVQPRFGFVRDGGGCRWES